MKDQNNRRKDERLTEASAAERVMWLHKRIKDGGYPNAMRLAERFGISHRQAQRDVEYLRSLGAEIEFVPIRRGFRYAAPFEMPESICDETPEDFSDLFSVGARRGGTESNIQIRVPYTATVRIKSLLTVTELGSFITARENGVGLYRCEFDNIGFFLGALLAADDDIRVVEPEWLRERLLGALRRLEACNSDGEYRPETSPDDAL